LSTLSCEPDARSVIRDAGEYNDLSDGMCIARAAIILRRDMFKEFPKFSGPFREEFIPSNCVPPSLVNFVATLLGGHNIDNGSPASSLEQTAAYSISELIRFNEVSLAARFISRNEAYKAECKDVVESLDAWVSRRCSESAQFLFWQTIIELEGMLLNFVQSIRESNFTMYVQMLKEICP